MVHLLDRPKASSGKSVDVPQELVSIDVLESESMKKWRETDSMCEKHKGSPVSDPRGCVPLVASVRLPHDASGPGSGYI